MGRHRDFAGALHVYDAATGKEAYTLSADMKLGWGGQLNSPRILRQWPSRPHDGVRQPIRLPSGKTKATSPCRPQRQRPTSFGFIRNQTGGFIFSADSGWFALDRIAI